MNPYDEITDKISKYTIQQAERGRFIEIIEWVDLGKKSENTPSKKNPVLAYVDDCLNF